MTTHRNEFGYVQLLGPGPLSERFTRVLMEDVAAYLNSLPAEYLVFTDTLKFRQDDQAHPLDVREMVVVSEEQIEGSNETVSVTLQVKS